SRSTRPGRVSPPAGDHPRLHASWPGRPRADQGGAEGVAQDVAGELLLEVGLAGQGDEDIGSLFSEWAGFGWCRAEVAEHPKLFLDGLGEHVDEVVEQFGRAS